MFLLVKGFVTQGKGNVFGNVSLEEALSNGTKVYIHLI